MSPPADGCRARRLASAAVRTLALALRITGGLYGPFDPGGHLSPPPDGSARRPPDNGRLSRAEKRLWEELVERLR
ncbi:hypothetical protein ACFVSN_12165 [Kitasatospora sp. NPDC057904]|uniref:hypothetical protein n=1 Tax=Kitasatospora sp. NPDC057904 TaxID=3346275 RepID=UPI0036DA0195